MMTGGCLQVDANKKMLTWEKNFKGNAGCGNAKRAMPAKAILSGHKGQYDAKQCQQILGINYAKIC